MKLISYLVDHNGCIVGHWTCKVHPYNKVTCRIVLILAICILLTYLLTPWSRVLEKLTNLQLVKKFPAICGTWRFITTFTSAHHLYQSWASSIQSIPPHPTSWRYIIILSSHLRMGLPSSLLPSCFPTKTLYTPLPSLPPYALHAPPISFLSILSPAQYWVSSTDH